MKLRFVLAAGILLAFIACDSHDDFARSENFSQTRTIEEAIEIAKSAASMLDDVSSRVYPERDINLDNIQILSNLSRSEPDTLIYIVNYKNNLGFAVISAQKKVEPLLAVTESGSYVNAEECHNPGLVQFMNMATDYVKNTSSSSVEQEVITEVRFEEIVNGDTIAPRVEVQWGQTGIYGAYCQNGISGCNNTAAAMVMSYFEYPKSIELKYQSNSSAMPLDWTEIKRHKTGAYTTCCSDKIHEPIGHLMRELGFRSGSKYLDNKTRTFISDTRKVLHDLGYNVGAITDTYNGFVKWNLKNGLIMMYGHDDTAGGHTWLCDGYKYQKTVVVEYIRPINEVSWTENSRTETELIYNHFNWGWNGMHNGYFYDGVYKASSYNFGNTSYYTVSL